MPGASLPTGGATEPGVGGGKPEKRLLSGLLPRVLLSLLLGGGFLWLLVRGGLPLVPPGDALSRLPWWSLAGYLCLVLGSTVLRTYRWLYLVRPIAPDIDARRVMGVSLVGFSAIFLAPLRSGEVVRP